jgi:hypothetical protein
MLMVSKTSSGDSHRETRRVVRFGLVLVAFALAVSACSSDPAQSDEYQALDAQYVDTITELEAVSTQLEAITTERDELEQQLSESQSELGAATEAKTELESSLATSEERRRGLELELDDVSDAADSARRAAEALVTDLLYVGADYEILADSGVPVAIGDDVVQLLSLPGDSWDDFNANDPTFFWRARIDALNDEELTAAFDTWWSASPGSDEEISAWVEIRLRLIRHLVEHLDEAAAGMDVSADA